MSQNAFSASPEFRVQIVNSVVPGNNDGPSLKELSVASLPEGALAYVVKTNAWYRYRPLSTATVDGTTAFNNVVDASGAGRWVRVVQLATATLAGSGTATLTNVFDLTGTGVFQVSGVTNAGTTGTRVAVKTSGTVATVSSSSSSDTSQVLVSYTETLTA